MKASRLEAHTINQPGARGAEVYSKLVLSIYDIFVLGFSNQFVWQCPSKRIMDHYNQHISDKHLDVGVGTGYFLDHCLFPSNTPALGLLDLNPNSLQIASHRLRRYQPISYLADIMAPLPPDIKDFTSIGLNYLLHCLPGIMASKGIIFEHLKPCLRLGGVVFGSTILGEGVKHNALGRCLMNIYNAKGIFSNRRDNVKDLAGCLTRYFHKHTIRIEGCVAIFVGWA